MWVAVGTTIVYSSDGSNWTRTTSADTLIGAGQLLGIAWGNNTWVAYGITAGLLYSADGITWSQSSSGTTLINSNLNSSSYKSIAYSDTLQRFVLGCEIIIYSSDGDTWTRSSNDAVNLGGNSMYSLCWNGSFFIGGLSGGNRLIKSVDGDTWTSPTITGLSISNIFDIKWNGSIFVAVGNARAIFYSADGLSWNTGSITGVLTNLPLTITWNGTYWVVGGENNGPLYILYSQDGITWTESTSGAAIMGSYFQVASRNVLPFTPSNLVYVGPAGPTGPTGSTGPTGPPVPYVYSDLIVGVSTFSPYIVYSDDGITWNNPASIPSIPGAGLRSVAWNGSMWVAVGGTILYSSDGSNWTRTTSADTFIGAGEIYGVAWGNNVWVVYGADASSYVLYSADGITWSQSSTGTNLLDGYFFTSSSLKSIAYSDTLQRFVLGCEIIIYSADGDAWTQSSNDTAILGGYTMYSLCWNGSFFIGGLNGGNLIIKSVDGDTWTAPTITGISGYNVYDIKWNGSLFVAVTDAIYYSTDGLAWNSATVTGLTTTPLTLTWNGTYWVVGGVNNGLYILYSPDGITWTESTSGAAIMGSYFQVASRNVLPFTPSNLVYVGPAGPAGPTGPTGPRAPYVYSSLIVGVSTDSPYIVYSDDGITWNDCASITPWIPMGLKGVAWNGSMWVAVGGTILYSSDGSNWTRTTSADTFIGAGEIYGVAWGNNTWVAYGRFAVAVLYSADGISWSQSSSGTTLMSGNVDSSSYKSIAYSDTLQRFVLASDIIIYSADGDTWTRSSNDTATLGGNSVGCLCWNGSFFIGGLLSGANLIIKSVDGNTWTAPTVTGITSDIIYDIKWNGSIFVAVGSESEYIYYSADGIAWNTATTPGLTIEPYTVTWNGTYWVVGGLEGAGEFILYSPDGITWTESTSGAAKAITYFQVASRNVLPFTPSNLIYVPQPGPAGPTGPGIPYVYNDLIVGVSNVSPYIVYSDDGITWNNSNSIPSIPGTGLNGVAWNGSIWVAVGTTIVYSSDGSNWTRTTSADTFIVAGSLSGIAWGNNTWVAYGTTAGVLYSADGISWSQSSSGTTLMSGNLQSESYKSLAYSDRLNRFVLGSDIIIYSSNGNAWTRSSNDTAILAGGTMFSLCWNGYYFIGGLNSAGSYLIVTSDDGDTWVAPTVTGITGINVYDIKWNGSIFVAVGNPNSIYYSDNGIEWNVATATGLTEDPFTITWNGTYWVVGGANNAAWVFYSDDGITWTESTSGVAKMNSYFQVASRNVLPFTPSNLVFSRSNFLYSIPYAPATPANWPVPPPASIQRAIDHLAIATRGFVTLTPYAGDISGDPFDDATAAVFINPNLGNVFYLDTTITSPSGGLISDQLDVYCGAGFSGGNVIPITPFPAGVIVTFVFKTNNSTTPMGVQVGNPSVLHFTYFTCSGTPNKYTTLTFVTTADSMINIAKTVEL